MRLARASLLGGGEGDRTLYLLHAMQALYQLSYAPDGAFTLPADGRVPTGRSLGSTSVSRVAESTSDSISAFAVVRRLIEWEPPGEDGWDPTAPTDVELGPNTVTWSHIYSHGYPYVPDGLIFTFDRAQYEDAIADLEHAIAEPLVLHDEHG